jgi:hypothetical protein
LELETTYLKAACVNPLAGERANKAVAILRFMDADEYCYKRRVIIEKAYWRFAENTNSTRRGFFER